MNEMEEKARSLISELYAGVNVERNFEALCTLMRPIIWKRAKFFIKRMEGYEFDDFNQEACIVICRIALKSKPVIHTTVIGYLSCSIWYEFLDLYYQYALKNGARKYLCTDFENPGLSYYRLQEIDFVRIRQEKARVNSRKQNLKKYIEKHGYTPDQAPPKLQLTEEEKREKEKAYREKTKLKRKFLAHEKYKMDIAGIIRTMRLSAREGDPQKGEPEFVLTIGKGGLLPFGATMSEEEYLTYLQEKYPSRRIKLSRRKPTFPDEQKRKREEYSKRHYQKYREKYHKRAVAYYQEHKEDCNAKSVAYYHAHIEGMHRYQHEYYMMHRDAIKEKSRVYYYAHRHEISERAQAYRHKNADIIKTKKHEYYLQHKEKISEYNRQWRSEHQEEIHTKNVAYYATHREENAKKSRAYYVEHHEERLDYARKYQEEHRDEINARNREKIAREIELSKTDPVVAAKREERLAKRRAREKEQNRRYREEHREEINARRRKKQPQAQTNESSDTTAMDSIE